MEPAKEKKKKVRILPRDKNKRRAENQTVRTRATTDTAELQAAWGPTPEKEMFLHPCLETSIQVYLFVCPPRAVPANLF